jgi:PPOX class probable F420-dependent enzyme
VELELTAHLSPADRERVEGRLRTDLIGWLTTLCAGTAQPVSVPVWFLLLEDGDIIVYSRPSRKLRNIMANPLVSLALDGTAIGSDVVSIEGAARLDDARPAADRHPAYREKYAEQIATVFGTPEDFAGLYSQPVVITPTRLHS